MFRALQTCGTEAVVTKAPFKECGQITNFSVTDSQHSFFLFVESNDWECNSRDEQMRLCIQNFTASS